MAIDMCSQGFFGRIFLLALLGAISACAGHTARPSAETNTTLTQSPPACPLSADEDTGYLAHVLVADRKGDYDQSFFGREMREVDHAAAGAVDPYRNSKTFEDQFANILVAFKKFHQDHHVSRILLFFDGGLNPRKQSIARAKEQTRAMMEDCDFPVFMVWRSSGAGSYWEQVSRVRDGRLLDTASVTTPLYVLSDLLQGIARAPASWSSQFWRWIDSFDENLDEPDDERARTLLQVQFPDAEQTDADFLTHTVVAVLTSRLKMVTAPLIEGIGRTAWENMVRRTRLTFRNAQEFENTDGAHSSDILRYPRGAGVFAKFIAEMEWRMNGAGYSESEPQTGGICHRRGIDKLPADTRLTIIGRSMGTIVINDMLRAFPELPYQNIVFMAGAASIRDSLMALTPLFLHRKAQLQGSESSSPRAVTADSLRFFNLSLHPVAEIQESNAFNVAPDGSLLAWIDDMYQSAPSPLDRTIGQWRNVAWAANAFPKAVRKHIYFRVFGFRPGPCDAANAIHRDPTMHDDFDLTCMHFWRENFWWSGN